MLITFLLCDLLIQESQKVFAYHTYYKKKKRNSKSDWEKKKKRNGKNLKKRVHADTFCSLILRLARSIELSTRWRKHRREDDEENRERRFRRLFQKKVFRVFPRRGMKDGERLVSGILVTLDTTVRQKQLRTQLRKVHRAAL